MAQIPGGPYPEVDENSDVQRRSLKAFQDALPIDRFLIRDERVEDYGVDCSLEVRSVGSATNLRAQVQLKGTGKPTKLVDGTYTRQVAAANLNYLLNGTSPLYILHDQKDGVLLYTWARDEELRIAAVEPNWRDQGNVTLHFSMQLENDLEVIWERIVAESSMVREVLDVLSRTRLTVGGSVTVTSEQLQVIGSDQAARILSDEGIDMVLEGRAQDVFDLWFKADEGGRNAAGATLAFALAKLSVGRYPEAKLCLLELASRGDQIEPDQSALLEWLTLVVSFRTGSVTQEEFLKRAATLSNDLRNDFAVVAKLESLRLEFSLSDRSEQAAQPLLSFCRKVIESEMDDGLKVQANLLSLTTQGIVMANTMLGESITLSMRKKMGGPVSKEDIINLQRPVVDWEASVEQFKSIVKKVDLPVLMADLLLERWSVRIQVLLTAEVMAVVPVEPSEPPYGREEITQALKIYEEYKLTEGALRAKLLLADLLELSGDYEEGKSVAQQVLPFAQALNVPNLVSLAEDHLAGQSFVPKIRNEKAADRADPLDVLIGRTDEEVEGIARQFLKAMELDDTRLPSMIQEVQSHHQLAVEHQSWCRHLELLQNLVHTKRRDTMYKEPLRFVVYCPARELRQTSDSSDFKERIDSFKTEACAGCSLRSPLT